MPYYPLPHSQSSAYAGVAPSDNNPSSHPASSSAGIRAVEEDYQPYDESWTGDDSFVNDGRPPSFSTGEGAGGAGLYLGGQGDETYDSDLGAALRETEPLRVRPQARSEPYTSYDPDLELHLDSPTPLYSPGMQGGRQRYDDYREDVKDPGEFEDSFEAGGGADEDEENEGEGSPVSFQGGFGAPPATAHLRRKNLTQRRVKLTEGNLVIPCAIPTRLLGFLPRKDSDEFTQTRYTAVTCGPEDFNKRQYTLRPSLYNRQTELFVVITMYNENEELFCRTLHGVMKNISQLCKRKKSSTWGQDGWKKVVVCIVADGRKAIHPRVLDCLAALGVYQPNVATNRIDDKPVQAHLYEHTTQMSIAPDLTFKGLEKGICPTQIMFCLKEKKYALSSFLLDLFGTTDAPSRPLPSSHNPVTCLRLALSTVPIVLVPALPPPRLPTLALLNRSAKKINSHRWALQAFCPQLEPNVIMLLDVGTKPAPSSLYYLWKAFDLNSNVGGACGEIVAMKGKYFQSLINPLVAAQNFEYKISNILDKPLESICGYISVLPGAFSAYRYIAVKNDDLGHGPLASYFKGEHLAGHDADLQTSNMYLAEDRILCWEIVAKRGDSWVLKYVKAAKGETDVPDSIAEFISQRRRWLNGSFFAGVYALTHTLQLFGTQHSRLRIFFLLLQAVYNLCNVVFAWIGLSSYWIFFMVLSSSLEDPSFKIPHIGVANVFMQYAYMGAVISCFVLSMGNRPKAAKWKYMTVMIVFSATTAYMFAAAGFCAYHAFKNAGDSVLMAQVVISLAATYGVYILSSLIALDPWHLVTSMAQYLLMAPIYINVLNIYAFANLHDFSWGTKEQNQTEIDLGITRKVGSNEVDMALPAEQADIDSVYDTSLHNLKTRPMIVPPVASLAQREEAVRDHYQSIRTNILLAWVLSNAILVATILEGDYASTFGKGGGNGRTQIYLVIILVFVAGMALVRFIGSTAFIIDMYVRIIGGWVQRRLFARRVSQGTGVRSKPALSSAGTEIKSEKLSQEDDDEDEGALQQQQQQAYEYQQAPASSAGGAAGTESWYLRG
ncbi:hypothetical protein JCM10213_003947 [Rhodosporidiobolus nylandii]